MNCDLTLNIALPDARTDSPNHIFCPGESYLHRLRSTRIHLTYCS